MRRWIAVAAALAVSCKSTWPDPTRPSGDVLVRETLREQVEAWNRGDLRAFMAGYENSPSTTFVSGTTLERGWQKMLDRFLATYPPGKQGTLSFSDVEITSLGSGEAAWAIGRFRLTGDVEASGRFTLVFRRSGDRFVIVHDHTAADPKPESAPK